MADVRVQPSAYTRFANQFTQSLKSAKQQVNNLALDVANKDTITSMAVALDPFRNDAGHKWCNKPLWAKATVATSSGALGTSIYLICRDKWLQKSLLKRRITGALLVLPAVYFAGYGVFTLFRKGTEWNSKRLERKATEALKTQNQLIANGLNKVVADNKNKTAEAIYNAINKHYVDMLQKENIQLVWDQENGKCFVALTKGGVDQPIVKIAIKKEVLQVVNQKNIDAQNAILIANCKKAFKDLEGKTLDNELLKSTVGKFYKENLANTAYQYKVKDDGGQYYFVLGMNNCEDVIHEEGISEEIYKAIVKTVNDGGYKLLFGGLSQDVPTEMLQSFMVV